MAVSFKKQALNILTNYPCKNIIINEREIPLYSNNMGEINVDTLQNIVNTQKLRGKTSPIAIVQYCTYIPWTEDIGPMIAFIWSWGGPWAYVYNIQFPDFSESGSVPLNRLVESIGIRLDTHYFMQKQ